MLGGALGSAARFATSTWCEVKWGTTFPWGTLVVNVFGSFLIGLIFVVSESVASGAGLAQTRALFITGFLGGFTTFSAFSLQTLALFQNGQLAAAFGNAIGSVILCLLFVWIGTKTGHLLPLRV